jgi:pheromone shutdown protein TraB
MEEFALTPRLLVGMLGVLLFLLALLLWKTIGRNRPMDWADLISVQTRDGRTVASIEKIGYIVGLVLGGWVVVTYTYAGKLTYDLFGLYLLYAAGIKAFTSWLRVKADRTEKDEPEVKKK